MTKLTDDYQKQFLAKHSQTMSLEEFLAAAKKDSSMYASVAERILKAIGEPTIVNTAEDPRLSRLFGNRVIRTYDAFSDFFGLEEVIERIVSFFTHAAQNLEEAHQILHLLGPVGSSKSSIAERLKELVEQEPIYVLCDKDGNPSPVNETPLSLFKPAHAKLLGIPARRLESKASPWATKRLSDYEGDISKFKVKKMFPSQDYQLAICKTEPGDENNSDISTLVGKLDIRKLEFFAQDDPDAYSYSGGLCRANQGILEFVEMFKSPIKVLHPLLTATQEKNYKGTEAIGAIPFDGVVLSHCNSSEWEQFRNNQNNEAFLDRIYVVEVPYCLRVDEEIKIYEKLIKHSELADAPCAPDTLKILAQFCVTSRLEMAENSALSVKSKVYNGEHVKEQHNDAKSLQEYKDMASNQEGFQGISTRIAFKILAEVFNFDPEEIAADPVHLLYVLEQTLKKLTLSEEKADILMVTIKKRLAPNYITKIGKEIQTAYLDSYAEFGQSVFDRYIKYADFWISDNDYRDPDTGQMLDREMLNAELTKIEKPSGISNPKDFRHEIVNFALRHQAKHQGANPSWTSYEKLKRVIESLMFSKTNDLLPVISFGGHGTKEERDKHTAFVERMKAKGYTEKQTRRLVEFHLRASTS